MGSAVQGGVGQGGATGHRRVRVILGRGLGSRVGQAGRWDMVQGRGVNQGLGRQAGGTRCRAGVKVQGWAGKKAGQGAGQTPPPHQPPPHLDLDPELHPDQNIHLDLDQELHLTLDLDLDLDKHLDLDILPGLDLHLDLDLHPHIHMHTFIPPVLDHSGHALTS